MRAKYLILAIALLCLLALPATALAADDSDGGKIDTSVTTVLDATGGDEAVPVIVYTDPGAGGVVDGAVPQRRRDHGPRRLRRRRRVPDAGRDRRARRERLRRSRSSPTTRSSGSTTRARSTSPTWRSAWTRSTPPAAGGPTGAGVGVAVLDSGIATTSDLGSSRIVGWKDFVNKQEDPVRRRRPRHLRRRPHRRRRHRVAAARPGRLSRRCSSAASRRGPTSSASRCSTAPARVAPPRSWPASLWAIAHKNEYNIRVLNLSIGEQPGRAGRLRPDRQGRRVRLEERHHGRLRRRQRGRVRPRRHPLPGQQPLRHHRRRQRHAADRRRSSDDAVTYYSSRRPDALGRVRQARPRGSRQPADLAAREGLLHRHAPSRRT